MSCGLTTGIDVSLNLMPIFLSAFFAFVIARLAFAKWVILIPFYASIPISTLGNMHAGWYSILPIPVYLQKCPPAWQATSMH